MVKVRTCYSKLSLWVCVLFLRSQLIDVWKQQDYRSIVHLEELGLNFIHILIWSEQFFLF